MFNSRSSKTTRSLVAAALFGLIPLLSSCGSSQLAAVDAPAPAAEQAVLVSKAGNVGGDLHVQNVASRYFKWGLYGTKAECEKAWAEYKKSGNYINHRCTPENGKYRLYMEEIITCTDAVPATQTAAYRPDESTPPALVGA